MKLFIHTLDIINSFVFNTTSFLHPNLSFILNQMLCLILFVQQQGIQFGTGFDGTRCYGSQNNDIHKKFGSQLCTETNHCGGIQAGMSTGENIVFSIAVRPSPAINQPQISASFSGLEKVVPSSPHYHACTVPYLVPIIEAVTALTLADCAMIHLAGGTMTSLNGVVFADKNEATNESLSARLNTEIRLKEQYQRRLRLRVQAEATRLPKKYVYTSIAVGGLLLGLFLGYRFFGRESYYASSFRTAYF